MRHSASGKSRTPYDPHRERLSQGQHAHAFLAELAEKRKRLKKSKYPLGDYESEEQRQADVDAVMASLRSDGRDAAMSTPAEQDEARTRYAIRRDEIRKQINALLAEGKSLVEIAKTLGLEKNDGPVCDND